MSDDGAGVDSICGESIDRFVLPGDCVGHLPPANETGAERGTIILGSGLLQDQLRLVASKAGLLRHSVSKKKGVHKYWVESSQRRYVPQLDDMVLGTVVSASLSDYKVDIGAAALATLDSMSFEGATRKNKPQLRVGGLVYARVTIASKDMEPELSCMSAAGKADGFGPVEDGYAFKVSLGLARELLHPACAVLSSLGRHFPYELAVGLNGRVWVKADTTKRTTLIVNAIVNSEYLDPEQAQSLVDGLVRA